MASQYVEIRSQLHERLLFVACEANENSIKMTHGFSQSKLQLLESIRVLFGVDMFFVETALARFDVIAKILEYRESFVRFSLVEILGNDLKFGLFELGHQLGSLNRIGQMIE